jgi:hypothetical protein
MEERFDGTEPGTGGKWAATVGLEAIQTPATNLIERGERRVHSRLRR